MTTATDDRTEELLNVESLPKFDVADHLDSPELVAAYLNEYFAEGDAAMIAEALGDASRAKGMAEVASLSGLARESLYKALRPGSQPRLETILRVLKALGFRLEVRPISEGGDDPGSDSVNTNE